MNEKHKFNENVEKHLSKIIIDDEYGSVKNSKSIENATFDSILDKFECKHSEKDYEWMSDIEYPLLASIILTDSSNWVGQQFSTRSFVEVKLEGNYPEDKGKCSAAKKCINSTLNNREIFHYHKFVRGRTINALEGRAYAICWWEKDVREIQVGTKKRLQENGLRDGLENPLYDEVEEPILGKEIRVDRFNYEIFDPKNIFMDNKYVYSLQQKDWIIARSETSFDQLKEKEKKRGYFNLNLAKTLYEGNYEETETARETYGKDQIIKQREPVVKYLDHLIRFGKIWATVKLMGEDGYPEEIEPGYDEFGDKKETAELIEGILEFIVRGNRSVLIRFQPTPFTDSKGNTYRPLLRGLCYIHPTKDTGLSSGKFLSEIQTATSDHFNMGSDRVKLSTLPTLIGNKEALIDNTTIYIEPQHVMEVNNVDQDLKEFEIKDDIGGTINMVGMLENAAQRLEAIFPTTMGDLPTKTSTTATAIAGAESKQGGRSNFKSLTWDYTFQQDFYWMILQMAWAFAEEETLLQMMGDDAKYFDPNPEYNYSPVTSAVETEQNRYRKLSTIDQFMGRLAKVPNPKIWKTLNYLLSLAFELFDKEFPDYKEYLLDEKAPVPESGIGGGEQVGALPTGGATNQSGVEQTPGEQFARGY